MKKLVLLGVLGFILSACARGPDEVLIDSFEGEISPKTVDHGSSDNSSVTVSADKSRAVCGQQSLKVEYNLHPSGYMWIARGYGLDVEGAADWIVEPQAINWPSYKAITLQVYGSNSAAVIALDIKDKGGELWRFLIDDDFSGWKEVTCPLKEFFPRGDWQPETADRNEKLDFPIISYQFEPRLPGSGSFFFDCIKVTRAYEKEY